MPEYRIDWAIQPGSQNPPRVSFVEAPDADTARAILNDQMERQYGYRIVIRDLSVYEPPADGQILTGFSSKTDTSGAAIITLGDNRELMVTAAGYLHVRQIGDRGETIQDINLGRATKGRMEVLEMYLDRLSIHAVDA